MKLHKIAKYWSLAWVVICAASAIAYMVLREWECAMFAVVSCAINHFCYEFHRRELLKQGSNGHDKSGD